MDKQMVIGGRIIDDSFLVYIPENLFEKLFLR